ncbi:23 kDa integral membrane protein [Clonorchis sinensis]|uniref:Tetraspanin n=1 Tax=Clonorchis sinensis TaxID=79923 RepID=A0A3R7D4M7_CLOSI|nr:23 kDa integral membrane protein [Clonorchis sinensis]
MVSLSCGYKCLQCMLVVFNVVVICCGIGLIVVGSIAEVQLKTYLTSEDAQLTAFVIFIIAFGCFLTVVGSFGFCGACKKNVCCLTMYIIFLVVFILGGVAAGIAGFVLKDHVKEYVDKLLTQTYKTYTEEVSRKLIDLIQKDLKCCGPDGNWPQGLGQMPASCLDSSGLQYGQGCSAALDSFIEKNILAVALCVFLFALLQILALVFAVCVCKAIQRGEDA